MSSVCSLCATVPFLKLPPFPSWLPAYHVPIDPVSDLVPFMPNADGLDDGDENVPDSRKLKAGLKPGFAHHQSLADLTVSATTCNLCRLIADGALAAKKIWDEAQTHSWYSRHGRSGPPKYELHLSAMRDPENGFVVWSVSQNNNEVFLLAGIGYCVGNDSPLKDHFRGRPISTSPGSETSIERYRSWLAECEHEHEKCPKETAKLASPTWPLRLLEIGGDDASSLTVKLVESPPVGIKYATLSHCWGDALKMVLDLATLQEYKQAIESSRLPKTYQDAILIARGLALEYIWIDSLCIIQDHDADWERESAKMAGIYSHSYVTIAASSAASDAIGFLNSPPPREYIDIPVTVESDDDNPSLDGVLKLFSVPGHLAANGSHYIAMNHLPLPSRAWALQERYLSNRTLLFGDTQTFYECATHFVSEDGFRSTQCWFSFHQSEMDTPKRKGHLGQGPEYWHRMGTKWYSTLCQYSDRKLSRERDKLPALSGIARLFQEMMGGEYVAGLWKSDLIEGLAFQCFGGEHSRPRGWRAPSWSWASVDGMLSVTDLGGWEDLVEVRDVKVELKGQNPFGEVKSGELHLACTLEKATVGKDREPEPGKASYPTNVRLCFPDDDPHGYYASFDVKDAKEGTHGMDLYGIPLAMSPSGIVYVMLVVPDQSDGRKAFRREGYCFAKGEKLGQRWREAKQSGKLVDVLLI